MLKIVIVTKRGAREAAVVGIPDWCRGETPAAFLVRSLVPR